MNQNFNSQKGEQDKEPSRPQRVRRPPNVFTYNTLGQPTIILAQTFCLDGAIKPFQFSWMLPIHQYHPPSCYGPLVYADDVRLMIPDLFTLLDSS